jgi:hypothetical protein
MLFKTPEAIHSARPFISAQFLLAAHTWISSALSHFVRPMLALSAFALAAPELSFFISEAGRAALSAAITLLLDLRSFLMFSDKYSGLGSKE